jgi:hypothetical protein
MPNSASVAKSDAELRQKLQTLKKNTACYIVGPDGNGNLIVQLNQTVLAPSGAQVSQVKIPYFL